MQVTVRSPAGPPSLRAGWRQALLWPRGLDFVCRVNSWSHPHTTLDPTPISSLTSPPSAPFSLLSFSEQAEQAGTGRPSPHTGTRQPSTFAGPQFPCLHNGCADSDVLADPPRVDGSGQGEAVPDSASVFTGHSYLGHCPRCMRLSSPSSQDPAWPSEWRREEKAEEEPGPPPAQ